ncbi:reverse transcriptase domain-containing protein [Priestia megaterium]|uniref:reverse transcriptase domain-containing protein n=1 Tax=Priestia megaterium TaxID=1404 RepID=UPI0035DA7533
MQTPDIILGILSKNSQDDKYVFKDLYRYLYNKDFYIKAYAKINSNPGNMTPGTDNETIDGFSTEKVDALIKEIKDLSYQPKPARRTYIDKKNGGKRPLGIPSFKDKLVQEVVRAILEAIYDSNFDENSHAFRPNLSCKTLLNKVKLECTGIKWWVEGDIKGFFDNIDHHTLINILRRKIKDERFINLIWKFIKAGYCEDWKFHNTYSGTPQGGIISPILSNIYLDQLDKFMKDKMENFEKGKSRKRNSKHRQLEYQISKRKKVLKGSEVSTETKQTLIKEIKELEKVMKLMPSKDVMDTSFKRLKYYRYADDFIVGIIGSKEDAVKIKEEIKVFLNQELKLELSEEKTLITHWKDKFKFLGYEIYISQRRTPKKSESGKWTEATRGKCQLSLPFEAMREFLLNKDALVIEQDGKWRSERRKRLLTLSPLEIITTYNAEIRGLYNYYNLANNVYKLSGLHNIMLYSFLKTLANKHKCKSVSKLLSEYKTKYKNEGKIGVWHETKKGKKFRAFVPDKFNRLQDIRNDENDHPESIDELPTIQQYRGTTDLEKRLSASKCEWCSVTQGPMEVHHIRKMKELKGKAKWEIEMLGRKRKTMVLCRSCHKKLHRGELH